MRKSTAIFTIFFPAFFAAAQQRPIDRFKHELTLAKENTNKVYLLSVITHFAGENSVGQAVSRGEGSEFIILLSAL